MARGENHTLAKLLLLLAIVLVAIVGASHGCLGACNTNHKHDDQYKCSFLQWPDVRVDNRGPEINEALLMLSETDEEGNAVEWYGVTAECNLNCQLPRIPDSCALVSSTHEYRLEARTTNGMFKVRELVHVGEMGVYQVKATGSEGSLGISTKVLKNHEPVSSWGPLAWLVGLAMVALTGWVGREKITNRCKWDVQGWRDNGRNRDEEEDDDIGPIQRALLAAEQRTTDLEDLEEPKTREPSTLSARGSTAKPAGIFESARSAPSQSQRQIQSPSRRSMRPERNSANRLESLDTFRGFSLALMIFVNSGGGEYWWLQHSAWNGLTVADLLFPWFVWIMGVSMAFSFQARREQRQTAVQMLRRALVRGFTLICIGLFLNNGHHMYRWRLLGVLQYFGVSYMWVAVVVVATGSWNGEAARAVAEAEERATTAGDEPALFADLFPHWREWFWIATAPALWLSLTFLVEVPGCPTGYLGPGGWAEHGTHFNCTGGSHKYIDETLFDETHHYQTPTSMPVYNSGTYDPEGVVGMLNAVLLTYLGLIIGRVFLVHKSETARRWRLFTWGVVLCLLGGILCGFSMNDGVIPVNKNLWSTSFVLVCGGGGCWVLLLFYDVVDCRKAWTGAPFKAVGQNSITVYCGSEIFEGYFPFSFATYRHDHAGALYSNFLGMSLWVYIAAEMSKRGIFIKI